MSGLKDLRCGSIPQSRSVAWVRKGREAEAVGRAGRGDRDSLAFTGWKPRWPDRSNN